ncbi:MAG: rod-binding protein [Planctomycetes bacterium]|nr:rod-binding protein [Planctomycetota bacterium]
MDGAGSVLQARVATADAQLDAAAKLRSGSTTPAEAAHKFESLFATLLVKEMRGTLSQGFFGEGPQADVFGGWLDQFVGEAIAKDGGLHLADGVKRGLERTLEAERAARASSANEAPKGADTTAAPEIQR